MTDQLYESGGFTESNISINDSMPSNLTTLRVDPNVTIQREYERRTLLNQQKKDCLLRQSQTTHTVKSWF